FRFPEDKLLTARGHLLTLDDPSLFSCASSILKPVNGDKGFIEVLAPERRPKPFEYAPTEVRGRPQALKYHGIYRLRTTWFSVRRPPGGAAKGVFLGSREQRRIGCLRAGRIRRRVSRSLLILKANGLGSLTTPQAVYVS